MTHETVGPPDWEALFWEETPYPGVFVFKLDEKINLENPDMPLLSVFALKVNPNSQIPRHIHKREPEWREQVTSYEPGNFEILRESSSEEVSNGVLRNTIKPREVFGVINNGPRPLYF